MINSKLVILIITLILATLASAVPYESADNVHAVVNLDITSALQRTWKGLACFGACRSSWGWTGNHFGADPWGSVLKAGDPLPYSDGAANVQSGGPESSSSEMSSDYSTTDPGLSIQDVTSSAEPAPTPTPTPTPTESFPIFDVPTFIKCVRCIRSFLLLTQIRKVRLVRRAYLYLH